MKAALVTHYIPNYRQGFLSELIDRNHLDLDLYSDHTNRYYASFEFIDKNNFNWTQSKVYIYSIGGRRISFQPRILRVIFLQRYDRIILTATKSDISVWLGLVLGKVLRKKISLWGHFKTTGKFERLVNRIFCSLSYSNIFYSDIELAQYSKRIIMKSFVAKNTITIDNSTTKGMVRFNTLIFTGRFTKGKKLDVLLKALTIVRTKNDVRLVMVGDGPEKKKISLMVSELGLTNNVELTGAIYNSKELSRLYGECLFSVIPSHAGLGIHSAFGNGRIVVTDDDLQEQPPEFKMIKHGINGYLYKSNDHTALAELISYCLDRPNEILNMGKNAKLYIESEYSVGKMVKGFVNALIYER